MSDIEDFFDDDDEYEYWEEEPVEGVAAWADDLAEHTVHSPGWQEGDPNYDPNDYLSDWDYYSDDYYDNDPAPRKIQGPSGTNENEGKAQTKRKRMDDVGGTKRRKLDESPANDQSLVKYWTEVPREKSPPMLETNGLEKVAILKDWRERFQTDSDELLGICDGARTHPQEVTAPVGKKESDSRSNRHKVPHSRLPKPRAQEKVVRRPKNEVKSSIVFTENKNNGVTQPSETGSKCLPPKSEADTLTNTNALATMPNGHQNSRKRKQPDATNQTEDHKVDDKPKRQRVLVSNSKRVTKETKAISDTNAAGKRTNTRSGKGGRK